MSSVDISFKDNAIGEHMYVVVDSDLEPRKYQVTANFCMSGKQAQEIIDFLTPMAGLPLACIGIRTGKGKKGNPVLGEDNYE
jgi:hypothetical protein